MHEIEPTALRPVDAMLKGQFGDLELLRGHWPIGPVITGWERSAWPMVPMARTDEKAGRAWLSTYDDDLKCIGEVEIPRAEATRYPYDRLMGAGAVEIRLTKAIARLEDGPETPDDA
jgi:hypothetical protein